MRVCEHGRLHSLIQHLFIKAQGQAWVGEVGTAVPGSFSPEETGSCNVGCWPRGGPSVCGSQEMEPMS